MFITVRYRLRLAGLTVAILLLSAVPLVAQVWDDGFQVKVTYEELSGEGAGSSDVTLSMTLPAGTPLLAREAALNSVLAALHDIWKIESVHEEVRGFLGPNIPMDVQRVVSEISGTDFIIDLIDAFDAVKDVGFSRFQADTTVAATERVALRPYTSISAYADAPRSFEWVVGGGLPEDSPQHEDWVIAALVNYSASILSFRSEFGRFPNSFAELRETGHLFIEPLNPYTRESVRRVDSVSPGNIGYQYVDNNTVVLIAYIQVGSQVDVVRREINLYSSSGSFNLLYRQTVGLSENDKQVARYTFQIAMILNEYYYQNLDLPYSVPQLEAEGFAYVSFPNPYTGRDAQQSDSLAEVQAGDYTFHRISHCEYYLVGYGASGEVLSVSKDFGASQLMPGALRAQ